MYYHCPIDAILGIFNELHNNGTDPRILLRNSSFLVIRLKEMYFERHESSDMST